MEITNPENDFNCGEGRVPVSNSALTKKPSNPTEALSVCCQKSDTRVVQEAARFQQNEETKKMLEQKLLDDNLVELNNQINQNNLNNRVLQIVNVILFQDQLSLVHQIMIALIKQYCMCKWYVS